MAASVIAGCAFVDKISWDAYNESSDLTPVIEKYRQKHGCCPEAVMVDKIYCNRDNINYCTLRGIRISGPRLGRPKKDEACDKKQAYIDSGLRNAIEGKFGIGKIRYGLGRLMAKLKDTSEASISLAFLAMNLAKALYAFYGSGCLSDSQWKYGKNTCVQVSVKESDLKAELLTPLNVQAKAIVGSSGGVQVENCGFLQRRRSLLGKIH